jgi:hypothetical protein
MDDGFIFLVGLIVFTVVLSSAFIALIARDRPGEPGAR